MNVLSIPGNCSSFLAKNALGLFLVALFLAFTQKPALSSDAPAVVVSEIAWMGTEIEQINSLSWWRYEWLEFYNSTNEKILIDGWKIELFKDKLNWTLLLSGQIEPNEYFLAVSSDKISPSFDLNYSNLGGKLNNGGQKIVLKNAEGKIIEEIDCSSGWFAGNNKTKQTMERTDLRLSGNDPENWHDSQMPGGTPGEKNSIPLAAPLNQGETGLDPAEENPGSPKTQMTAPKNFLLVLFLSFGLAFSFGFGMLYLKKKIKA